MEVAQTAVVIQLMVKPLKYAVTRHLIVQSVAHNLATYRAKPMIAFTIDNLTKLYREVSGDISVPLDYAKEFFNDAGKPLQWVNVNTEYTKPNLGCFAVVGHRLKTQTGSCLSAWVEKVEASDITVVAID